MSPSPLPFSKLTISFHWIIALSIIGMLAFGIYIEDFVPGKLADGSRNPLRGELMGLHKSIGALILVLALARVFWRISEGWPTPVQVYKQLELTLAKLTHWLLIIGTVAMPLSGIIMTQAAGRAVPVFGLFDLPMIFPESKLLGGIAHQVHGIGAWVLIAAILLHFVGALKHHLIDKDATLKRMLGSNQLG